MWKVHNLFRDALVDCSISIGVVKVPGNRKRTTALWDEKVNGAAKKRNRYLFWWNESESD